MNRPCRPPPIVLQAVVAASFCVGLAGATCAFRFAGYPNISELPIFTLPPAELDSPGGDWAFNTATAIVYIAINDTEEEEVDCTGDAWRYQTADGDWRTEVTYPSDDMVAPISVSFDGFFDATGGEVTVSSIPASIAPAVSDTLYGRTIQLNLTCNQADTTVDEQDSCVQFQVDFTNYSPVVDVNVAQYRFNDPAMPGLVLPRAQPDSPGDEQLNVDNPIVKIDGSDIDTGCNGDTAEYLGEDGEWYFWFTGSDGQKYNLTHVFYATEQDHVNIATIQEVWSPNLEAALYNRTVRLLTHCNNEVNREEGYLLFRVGSTSFSETCDSFSELCEDSGGADDESGANARAYFKAPWGTAWIYATAALAALWAA